MQTVGRYDSCMHLFITKVRGTNPDHTKAIAFDNQFQYLRVLNVQTLQYFTIWELYVRARIDQNIYLSPLSSRGCETKKSTTATTVKEVTGNIRCGFAHFISTKHTVTKLSLSWSLVQSPVMGYTFSSSITSQVSQIKNKEIL